MREFKLEPYIWPEARRAYNDLSEIYRADVDRRIDFLCQYPEPDDEVTFAWPEEGPGVCIFYDRAWVLTYRVVDDGSVLEIFSLDPAG